MEQMARNGDIDLTEKRTLEKFLCCMLRKYAQIIMSIETLLDFEQLTVEAQASAGLGRGASC